MRQIRMDILKKMGPIYYKNKFIDLSPVHLRPEIPKMDFFIRIYDCYQVF
mgnify:CR=1 FL=1